MNSVYDTALQELLHQWHAQLLTEHESHRGYYLPHFGVYKPSSTTPVRLVFNASASRNGQRSLNNCIFKGVWQQTKLIEILIRWRMYSYIADIRKAFLQIRVHQEDRQFLRFIWYINDQPRIFQLRVLLFGAAASPYILYTVLVLLFDRFGQDVRKIVKDTYMDNCY